MVGALTVNEAVALFGLEERVIRKEVEYGLFGPASPPRLKLAALVYLRMLPELGLQPSVDDRKRIYSLIDDAFARLTKPVSLKLSPVLELKLEAIIDEVEASFDCFELWKKSRVVIDPDIMGGEPVFSNTRITVRHIGSMMLRGRSSTLDEIREDYPSLSLEDIEFARQYTVAYPRVGRPRASQAAAR